MSSADRVESVVDDFRLGRQEGQSTFVEVRCEAAGIAPRLATVCEPFGVPVYAGGGFDGLKGKRAAAERAAARSVPTLALHIGDYDLHGRWIFASTAEDVAAWVPSYVRDGSPWYGSDGWRYDVEPERIVLRADATLLEVRRFAVTEAQAEAGLVEPDEEDKAEAVPFEWDILRDELDVLLDPGRREQVLEREESEKARLREQLAERWSA